MRNLWIWFPGLELAIGGVMAYSAHSAIAQITPDGTLPNNSLTEQVGKSININGGTKSGSNLFHSFDQFSVPDGITANFQNIGGIQNIFSRVTGKSISNIEGTLKAEGVSLFLINPNGIVFGPKASLQIGGSFIGSTASSVIFDNGAKFSATDPQTQPLLTVITPIGLQFGATAAPIHNLSQVAPNSSSKIELGGLQVNQGKTLALVGGDITLEGGSLTANSGRIELGSVAANSLVKLKQIEQGWSLGYEDVKGFQNIRLMPRSDNGNQIQSRVDVSGISATTDTAGTSGGSIQVRGRNVEIIGNNSVLASSTFGEANGQDITIIASKLIVQDNAQIITTTNSKGKSGNLIVNALESVELIGGTGGTGLLALTFNEGKAGDITIKTRTLRLKDGAAITAYSATDLISPTQPISEGKGGNITVDASDLVEIAGNPKTETFSILSASTLNYGNAGTVNITTGQLIVRDRGLISVGVNSAKNLPNQGDQSNLGTPGLINVNARSILLENKGIISSTTQAGNGANINLQVQNTLLMRGQSQISASAGQANAGGNGGNITINAPKGFVVATPLGNNDITANGFSGAGGNITINAKSIFGFVPRTRADLVKLLGNPKPNELDSQYVPTSDITAFSKQNRDLNGVIQINTPDIDPKKLVELPENLIDTAGQIAAACGAGGKLAGGSFTATGRGGVVADPTDVLTSEAVLTDWISVSDEGENRAGGVRNNAVTQKQGNIESDAQKDNAVNSPEQIVEAQGWVIDARGNVVLVAQAPTVTPHSPGLKQADCAAH
ncbi:filamentous hemagglutinin family N-terminal domain protein [Cylindrospermum stagnale PCC 7417]|uniref:Filamentous hemagglutinin family N-terminal domain protein n=1 Tax=Cylindrospermum stagnale PCC 7417 TaxID=56107 RepID=K9WYR6_9NOST|nr:filamentous hemagglutinin N-terminal domain-containing protein [Cylindrospermum stagnale]AFZ24637.1 filamentous hemagglutinin family N-terminal domain protein [Cylindrospermum stagnale PCC 7417]